MFTDIQRQGLIDILNQSQDEGIGKISFNAWEFIDMATLECIYCWLYELEKTSDNDNLTKSIIYKRIESSLRYIIREVRVSSSFMKLFKVRVGLIDKNSVDYTFNMYSLLFMKGYFDDNIIDKPKKYNTNINRIFDFGFNQDKYQFYVYYHFYEGKVIYIGSGQGNRYIDLKERGRGYKNYCLDKSKIEPRIMFYFKTEEEARAFEKSLIIKCKNTGTFLTNQVYYDYDCYGNLITSNLQTSVLFRKMKNPN